MPDGASKLPLGATPGKLTLIGLLGVILVVVLLAEYGGVFSSSPVAATTERQNGQQQSGQTANQRNADRGSADRKDAARNAGSGSKSGTAAVANDNRTSENSPEWPRVAAEQAVAENPFSMSPALAALLGPPPASAQPERAEASIDEIARKRAQRLQETLNVLRTHGVSMILDDGSGPVAAIGDRMLRVGDRIGEFRVVEINVREGVVLAADDES